MIASEETFRHLMIRAQGGDRLCYSTLLVECEKWLRRYFARKISPAAIDDLVQETLISVHRKRASYDPARAFLPWLAALGRRTNRPVGISGQGQYPSGPEENERPNRE